MNITFKVSLKNILCAGAVMLLITTGSPAQAGTGCEIRTALPPTAGNVVTVETVGQLNTAMANLVAGTTILLKPGIYSLSSTLYVRRSQVTLRGDGDSCADVVLRGRGMDNPNYGDVPHGVWSDSVGLTLMNLTITDMYYHGVILNSGAQSPTLRSIQVLDTGQQLVKSNPTSYGVGVDNGLVTHSRFGYTNGTPATDHGTGAGYTNGVDVHAGDNWVIRNSRFENFHTPDGTAWPWNPAVLMWNGSTGTIVESNVFINVDRAIALGLVQRSGNLDHQGGVIRNNMIYNRPGLFSAARRAESDGLIVVWNSRGTAVAHNTVLSNGNNARSIEFRFDTTTAATAVNNLVDSPIGGRNGAVFSQSGNFTSASSSMFVDAATADLRLVPSAGMAIDAADATEFAQRDFFGNERGASGTVDVGAHEFGAVSPPNPPRDVRGESLH